MYLIDSNIVIYSYFPENEYLIEFILKNKCYISVISKIETLGYYKLSKSEKNYLEYFFEAIPLIQISNSIIDKSIEFRQQRKMTLGDSIIAASAYINNLTLVTANIKDFERLDILLLNPLL